MIEKFKEIIGNIFSLGIEIGKNRSQFQSEIAYNAWKKGKIDEVYTNILNKWLEEAYDFSKTNNLQKEFEEKHKKILDEYKKLREKHDTLNEEHQTIKYRNQDLEKYCRSDASVNLIYDYSDLRKKHEILGHKYDSLEYDFDSYRSDIDFEHNELNQEIDVLEDKLDTLDFIVENNNDILKIQLLKMQL